MYRIHFDPKTGRFIIQVATGMLGLFWTTVGREIHRLAGESPVWEPLRFEKYRDACLHVDTIGLSALYDDRSINKFHAHMGR